MMKKYVLLLSMLCLTLITYGQENIDFPDANFKNALLAHTPIIDTDGNGEISKEEAENTAEVYLPNKNIIDLAGIEYFINMRNLTCSMNKLLSVDLTQNTSLVSLKCEANQLISLDLTYNKGLEVLSCGSNQLASLDLTQNTNLRSVSLDVNQLTSLDLTQNTSLGFFSCDVNQLTSLDVTQNRNLVVLSCYSNQLTSLDVTQSKNLETLVCDRNQLASLDVTQNTKLETLNCGSNQLTSLDVRNCKLSEILFGNNQNLSTAYLTEQLFRTTPELKIIFPLCPKLQFICVDSQYIPLVENLFNDPNYTACTVSSSCDHNTLSGSINASIKSFRMYPNHSKDVLNIQFSDNKKEVGVTIIDVLGKIVQKESFSNTDEINLSHQLDDGLYWINLADTTSKTYVRFIVKK